ncbi:PDZ domain-containing protein [Corynebacterium qintianiae]|uniref:YlbL family protein n=1 Tax=Corynebacterium qintianiae TaxID=2709392 RepID=UPI0013EAD65B|nr:PDZ domain-containing protein [Corynebacterium qintianiae]
MTETTALRQRRWSTIVWGAVPVGLLALALSVDHVPFTDVTLTVPYAAQGPGPTFNTLAEIDGTPVVDIEGAETDDTSGNLNMTTVSVRTNMTLAQALGRWIGTEDTLVPMQQVVPPDVSEEEFQQFNEAAFVASEASATVAAMKFLGMPTEVVVHDVVPESAAEGSLEPGDVITAVGGTEVSEPGQVQEIVLGHAPGDDLELTVDRDGETRDVGLTLGESSDSEGTAQLGILMTSKPEGDISVTYNLKDVGGPSAGMMFSLAVIDKLSPGALNGGKFVAGTGTIAEDGEVGPIGGISHKIRGARDSGAELFLAPADNCAEAAAVDSGGMVVARVATLDDAVAAMRAFTEGRDVTTCG